ncbi:MAG: NEW3 domain-containing protein [Nitrososphaeria archaeon]
MSYSLEISKKFLAYALICSLLIVFPIVFVNVFAQLQGSVHGIVVDENGVVLDGVQVQAYAQNGAFTGSTYTKDGYFNMFLEYGTYTLYFVKDGYARVSKSIFLQSIDLDLGNITLSKAIKLSTTSFELAASPGEVLTIPFTLSNVGGNVETVSFYCNMPENWVTRILDSGREVLSAIVSPSQTLSFLLEITVPTNVPVNARYNLSLIASGTVNSTLNFIVFVKSQPTSNLIGRVIDEDGVGLDNVYVQASSSDGSIVAAVYTFKDGYFNLTLPKSSSITLTFTKEGYVKITRNIILQYANVYLGDIILQKTIGLSTPIASIVGNPGSIILLPFTISNFGDRVELLQFSVDAGGWQTRILTQSKVEVSSIILSPNSNVGLQLEVTVPDSFVGERLVKLTVKGKLESRLAYNIIIKPAEEGLFSCDLPGKSVSPGGSVNFKVSLKNIMDIAQRFSLSFSLPSGWSGSLKTSSGEGVSEVLLEGGKAVDLTVSVTTSSEASPGTYNVTVKACSSSLSDSITLSVYVLKPVTEIRFEASPPYVDVYAGSNARFKLSVANLGSSNELLNLSIEGLAQGLTGRFEDVSKQEITKVYVGAGESKEFYAVVSVPKGSKLASQSFLVRLSNSEVNSTLPLTLNVLGLYDVTITNQNFYTSLNVGGSGTFSLTVGNTGSQNLTNLKVLPGSVPDGFTVTVDPSFVYSLPVDKETTFTINIQTQSNVNAGNYYIDFTVVSDQTQAKQFTLRVEVLQETSWLIYASVLLLLAIVSLFFIYRKFGRR